MEKFDILDKKKEFSGHIIDVYTMHVKTPTGNVAEWDFIEHKGASCVVPVDEDGKIILVRQYRGATDSIMLELPAGGRDSYDEDFMVCAKRELEEETGFRSENVTHLIDINTAAAYTSEKIAIYVAKDLIKSKQNFDEDEFLNVEKYTLEEIKKMIYELKITDAKTVAGIFAYEGTLS